MISIIIRTLNEGRYLEELLKSISDQNTQDEYEVIVIDSGSTDDTLDIARSFGTRLDFIEKTKFSFGRSLNQGCDLARGEYLVFISGHCIPRDNYWLAELIRPIKCSSAGYTYGRQLGTENSKFSERQIFAKYFPDHDRHSNFSYFANNANACISKSVWQKYKFNEEITGLEDMELAKRFVNDGGQVAYAERAAVFHIHDESWLQTFRRYEREAQAMKIFAPEMHLSFSETARFFLASVLHDWSMAIEGQDLARNFFAVIAFRAAYFFGTFYGGRAANKISADRKHTYFYPKEGR